jgi:hypothetical protein
MLKTSKQVKQNNPSNSAQSSQIDVRPQCCSKNTQRCCCAMYIFGLEKLLADQAEALDLLDPMRHYYSHLIDADNDNERADAEDNAA